MLRYQYAETLLDDQGEARARERIAFDRSIELFRLAEAETAQAAERARAIAFSNKLWCALIEDLGDAQNGLPQELKAQLISIGIWVLRETEALRADPNRKFDDIIAVSDAIRGGLL